MLHRVVGPGTTSGLGISGSEGCTERGRHRQPRQLKSVLVCTTLQSEYQRYDGHFTLAGAKVVPENSNGDQKIDNWMFYYKGWTADDFDKKTYVRGDAVHGNLKPASRKGCLNVDVFRKHHMTPDRMKNEDALFFYQLLFPICNPKDSGVDGDNRMPYFSYAVRCTNGYAS